MGGVVVHRNGQAGMYVQEGSRIYTIADLTHLWVQLDAYESDLLWLRYGQHVEFTTEAYPGEVFTGTISFLSPELDPRTRTVKVRVNLDNPEGKLKPEMFVRAIVRTDVAAGGRVMDPDLAGKWICPMHPEVVRDEPGLCDVCEMDLVTTESQGYMALSGEEERPLVIPASAALITGTRAIVYVEVPGADEPTFEGREIVLGPRAGDWYLVKSGLAEGERVVTQGNFKIDSELQIRAKPSMMTPEGGGGGGHHHHGAEEPSEAGGRRRGQACSRSPRPLGARWRTSSGPGSESAGPGSPETPPPSGPPSRRWAKPSNASTGSSSRARRAPRGPSSRCTSRTTPSRDGGSNASTRRIG